MKKVAFAVSVFAIALAGCSAASRDEAVETRTREAVAAKLKDPTSAVFEGLRVVRSPSEKEGWFAVCGVVNGRNSFGAMSGAERFVARGIQKSANGSGVLEIATIWFEGGDRRAARVADGRAETLFEELHWNAYCTDDRHPPTFSAKT